jgi:hypothetical protein
MGILTVMMSLKMRPQSRMILTLMRKMIELQVAYQMISMTKKMNFKKLIMTLINLLQKMINLL